MTILNDKDATTRLENTRPYEESDPVYWSVLNRPLEDLAQRDADLNHILFPARGLRVRQEIPASTDVEIEAGSIVQNGLLVSYAGATQNIPLAGVGKIRIDFIWFNIATNTIAVRTGTEEPTATGFIALRADPTKTFNLPVGTDAGIPLAYVYTDDTITTVYDETIAANTAGYIEDVRPAPGANQRVFENSAAVFNQDQAGGAVGVSEKVPRSDHRHPMNVDGTVPEVVAPDNVAGTGSASARYAYRAHVHAVTVETNAAGILTDAAAAAVGSANKLVRSDHRHPINVDAVVPAPISYIAGSAGTSAIYSHRDHVHFAASPTLVNSQSLSWVNSPAVQSTAAFGFTPRVVLVYAVMYWPSDSRWTAFSSGFCYGIGASSVSYCMSHFKDADNTGATYGPGCAGMYVGALGGGVLVHNVTFTVTAFSAAGMTVAPVNYPAMTATNMTCTMNFCAIQ